MSPVPWSRIYAVSVTADTTVTTTTETVLATVSGVSTDGPGQRVRVTGWAQVTPGTGTTSLTLRIRRGVDATGALVGEANAVAAAVAAGSAREIDLEAIDVLGDVAGQSYVLTIQQTAATANGTVLQSQIRAEILP
jgi:hypothetical protein